MGKKLDYDPQTKTESTFHYDHDKTEFTVQSSQDVTGILKDSKKSYSVKKRGDRHGDLEKVSHIPMNIMGKMIRENRGDTDGFKKDLKKFVNDPDYRKFRTRPGKY